MLGLFKTKTLPATTEELLLQEIVQVKNLLLQNYSASQLGLSFEEYDFLATSSAHLSWFYQPLSDIWAKAHAEKRIDPALYTLLSQFISVISSYAQTHTVNPTELQSLRQQLSITSTL